MIAVDRACRDSPVPRSSTRTGRAGTAEAAFLTSSQVQRPRHFPRFRRHGGPDVPRAGALLLLQLLQDRDPETPDVMEIIVAKIREIVLKNGAGSLPTCPAVVAGAPETQRKEAIVRITKTTTRSFVLAAAALAMGSALVITQAQADGLVLQKLPPLNLVFQCQSARGSTDFPHAEIKNISGSTIKHGAKIGYRLNSGVKGSMVLSADLKNNDSVWTPEGFAAGYSCNAYLL